MNPDFFFRDFLVYLKYVDNNKYLHETNSGFVYSGFVVRSHGFLKKIDDEITYISKTFK